MNIGPSGSIPAKQQVTGSRSPAATKIDLSASSDLPEAVFAELRRPFIGKDSRTVGPVRFEASLSQVSSVEVGENPRVSKPYLSTGEQTVPAGIRGAIIDVVG